MLSLTFPSKIFNEFRNSPVRIRLHRNINRYESTNFSLNRRGRASTLIRGKRGLKCYRCTPVEHSGPSHNKLVANVVDESGTSARASRFRSRFPKNKNKKKKKIEQKRKRERERKKEGGEKRSIRSLTRLVRG